MKKAIAAGAIAGLAIAGAGAGVANAAYPPQPIQLAASTSQRLWVGDPDHVYLWHHQSVHPWQHGQLDQLQTSGDHVGGDASGAASVSASWTSTVPARTERGIERLTLLSRNGPYEVTLSTVTITGGTRSGLDLDVHRASDAASPRRTRPPRAAAPSGGGGSQAGGTTGGGLAQTGGNNTLTIAAVGAGLLLAGVGAVVVARRREGSNA